MSRLGKVAAGIVGVVILASCSSVADDNSGTSDGNTAQTSQSSPESSDTGSTGAEEGTSSASSDTTSDDAPAESLDGIQVAFANLVDAGELTATVKKGIQEATETVGANLQTYDNKFDASATLDNAKVIAQSGPDMVLEWNPVASTAAAVEREFRDASIACIAVNTEGNGYCPWFNADIPKLCGESGTAMGRIAAERGWSGSDTTVVLIEASKMGATPNQCLGEFYHALQQELDGLDPLESPTALTLTTTTIGDTGIQVDTGNGLRDEAYQGVKDTLQSIDESRHVIVYGLSDDAAFGGWRAVQEANRSENSMTGGLGGDPASLEELRTNPNWVIQGDLFMGHWGQYLLAMTAAMRSGATLPDLTTSPVAVLTKELSVEGTSIAPISEYYEDGQTVSTSLPPLIAIENGNTGPRDGSKGNDYLADTGVLQLFGNVSGLK